jgi:hypothetical protein
VTDDGSHSGGDSRGTPSLRRRTFARVSAGGVLAATGLTTAQAQTQTQSSREIEDWHDLNAIRDDLSGEYELVADLDEDTAGYDEHVADKDGGWEPIASNDDPFTGVFSGGGNTISGLSMYRDTTISGIFGATFDATVENITVSSADVTGAQKIAVVIGAAVDSTIEGVSIEETTVSYIPESESKFGSEDGVGTGSRVGGIVGFCEGSKLTDVEFDGSIDADDAAGGIAGIAYGTVIESATVDTTATGNFAIGGVVGVLRRGAEISGASVTASVSVETLYAGGCVGRCSRSSISDIEFSGDVSAVYNAGGVVGATNHVVRDATVDDATISGSRRIGGVIGYSTDEIYDDDATRERKYEYTDCYVGKNTAVTGEDVVGGFAGNLFVFNSGECARVETYADVEAKQNYAGGFAGGIGGDGIIQEIVAAGSAHCGNYNSGGIAGKTGEDLTVEDALVLCEVTGESDANGALADSFVTFQNSVVAAKMTTEQGYVTNVNYGEIRNVFFPGEDSDNGVTSDRENGNSRLVYAVPREEMTGEQAAESLSALDFDKTWTTMADPPELPALRFQRKITETFEIADLQVPEQADPAAPSLNVRVEVSNTGKGGGQQTVTYQPGTEREQTKTVRLGVDESTTISFSPSAPDRLGEYEQVVETADDSATAVTMLEGDGEFEVFDMSVPETGQAGTEQTATVTVLNSGLSSGERTLNHAIEPERAVDSGETVFEETVSLGDGDMTQVEYSFTAPDEPGDYTHLLTVGSGVESAEYTVEASPTPTSTPTPTPDNTETPTATPTGDGSGEGGETADDDGAGFTVGGAIASVGGVAYLLKQRFGSSDDTKQS